ncbi:MAG: futalosine hydrolase [Mucilaginibacter sp.]
MMMQILIVAATQPEIQPLLDHFGDKKPFDVLITGVGMVATAYAMGVQLGIKKYTLVINLGIAGSFDRRIELGEVVEVIRDTLSELGAENDTAFIPIEQLGFGKSQFDTTNNLSDFWNGASIKKVNAITVNTVHGNEASITNITKRIYPQLESMEGAAFFYACQQMNVPAIQIRAVSNYVEKRNRDNWKIGLAIKNLNNFAIELISTLIQA